MKSMKEVTLILLADASVSTTGRGSGSCEKCYCHFPPLLRCSRDRQVDVAHAFPVSSESG
jgi:hypothetical protein